MGISVEILDVDILHHLGELLILNLVFPLLLLKGIPKYERNLSADFFSSMSHVQFLAPHS